MNCARIITALFPISMRSIFIPILPSSDSMPTSITSIGEPFTNDTKSMLPLVLPSSKRVSPKTMSLSGIDRRNSVTSPKILIIRGQS